MEILLEDGKDSFEKRTQQSNHKAHEPIFGAHFQVEEMTNPTKYLPRYENH